MSARYCVMMCVLSAGLVSGCGGASTPDIRVGSKSFTESVILGEMAAILAEDAGATTEHVQGLGGTRLVWEALKNGQIDVYAEYTGTISYEILAGKDVFGLDAIREHIGSLGLGVTESLGFNNTYAIGMTESTAERLGIRRISDLTRHPDLTMRFSNEFMQRGDGWGPLSIRYQLPQKDVRGLEHALAYEALEKGMIQVTDLYATDAKIRKLQLRVLEDDLSHFSAYHAVFVYRNDLHGRMPAFVDALKRLEAGISEVSMVGMNARVELDGATERQAAAEFLAKTFEIVTDVTVEAVSSKIWMYTRQHLHMVLVSLLAATIVAIPLGILAAGRESLAQPILGTVGIIQTVPAIALLVLLIRPISYFSDELGYPQAVVALFLYSLLPIVRNTYAGLKSIPIELQESAIAMGLSARARLWRIELPMASRTILAGLKTAAVLNVGFATLGGFIGAGGFGEPIFTGIRINDYGTILQGAVPAAMLALLVQGVFEIAERWVVPTGLRLKSGE